MRDLIVLRDKNYSENCTAILRVFSVIAKIVRSQESTVKQNDIFALQEPIIWNSRTHNLKSKDILHNTNQTFQQLLYQLL